MWIKSYRNNGNVLLNSEWVVNFNVKHADRLNEYHILYESTKENGKVWMIAHYKLKSTADSAVDRLYEALERGDYVFEFPPDGDPCLSYADGIIHGGGLSSIRKSRTNGKTK